MRIAYLNTYGNGSTGRIVDLLKEASSDKGFVVKSYFSREYCSTPNTSQRFFSKSGFYFDAIKTRLLDNHGLNSSANTRRLIKDLKNFNPDIIHIHNLHGYWINYKMLFSFVKKYKIKIVFTLHDCWSFTGHCTHFDYIGCEKWKIGCNHCPQKNQYPKSILFDGSKRNFNNKKSSFCSLLNDQMTIVTPSEWLKSKVDESFLNKYNCVVINNGVNTSIFKETPSNLREKYNYENKKIFIAVASYWDERKGLDFFINLAEAMTDCEFVYIGKEKDNKKPNLPNLLHIERTDSQKELAEWYSVADLFINPTLEDTYPTTNLESIACGTPVLTFDTGGSPEIVRKSGYGIVVRKTLSDLLKAIQDFLDKNITFDKRLVRKDLFDMETFCEQYINLYLSITNKLEH